MSLIKWSRASERYGTIMLSRNLVVLLVGFVLVIQVSSLDLRPRAGSKIIGKALPAEGVPIIEGQEPVDTAIVKAVEIPEKKVTYEGTQLWKVFPEEKNAKFISYLQNAGGMIFIFIFFFSVVTRTFLTWLYVIRIHIAQNIAETCQKYFQSFIAIEIFSQHFCQLFQNILLQHYNFNCLKYFCKWMNI